ncbi:hypothetical protein D1007_49001 [Hordeum vulgare]|nr:hypothetical protein D1007_49001 [Hordeum vulgare]
MSSQPNSPPPGTAADVTTPASPDRPRATLSPDLNSAPPLPGDLSLSTAPAAPLPAANLLAPPPSRLPSSISDVVDFKLALDGTNFIRWRNFLNLILARYHAENHVQDGAADRLSNPQWRDDDNTIVLWFFATVDGALLDVVAPADSTAYTIWKRLHEYFLANEAELAMHLGQEFRACVRGDLSVNDYCRRLQNIAAALADVREPVSDRTLTLQMLDGIGKKFELQAAIIQSTVPLPSFAQARSRLALAELTLDKRAR